MRDDGSEPATDDPARDPVFDGFNRQRTGPTDLSPNGQDITDRLPVSVDWHALFAREPTEADWIVDDFWPARRAISIVADRKAGKSLLMLWVAACLARGLDPWTGQPRPPVVVAYWDFEMAEDDVHERAADEFGLQAGDLDRLRYYLLPNVPPLDTPEGGWVVLATLRRDGAEVAIFDRFGRTVSGPEDQADTIRAYYRCTALELKRAGIASARLDHTGHSEKTRARGSSSKADDVDVAWVFKRGDRGAVQLDHYGITRLSWVGRRLDLVLVEGPPSSYRRGDRAWPAGTAECARLLDDLRVPLDASASGAGRALRDKGMGRRKEVIQAAVRYRHERPEPPPGTARPPTARNHPPEPAP